MPMGHSLCCSQHSLSWTKSGLVCMSFRCCDKIAAHLFPIPDDLLDLCAVYLLGPAPLCVQDPSVYKNHRIRIHLQEYHSSINISLSVDLYKLQQRFRLSGSKCWLECVLCTSCSDICCPTCIEVDIVFLTTRFFACSSLGLISASI